LNKLHKVMSTICITGDLSSPSAALKQEFVLYIDSELDEKKVPMLPHLRGTVTNRFSKDAFVRFTVCLECGPLTNKQEEDKQDFSDWEREPCGDGDRWELHAWATDKAYRKVVKRYGGSASAQAQQDLMDGNPCPAGGIADTRLTAFPS
jgi:hypothetical protein